MADFKKIVEIGIIDLNFNVIRSRGKVTGIDLGSKKITGEDELIAMRYVRLHDMAFLTKIVDKCVYV